MKTLRFFLFLLAFSSISTAIASKDILLTRANYNTTYQCPWSGEVAENQNFSANGFLTWYGDTYLKAKAITWEVVKDEVDNIGMQHIRYQQYYEGLKVEHGTMILHLKKERVVSFNGEIYTNYPKEIHESVGMLLDDYFKIHKGIEYHKQPEKVYMAFEDGQAYCCNVYLAGSEQDSTLDKLFISIENERILRIEPQHVDADAKGKANTHYIGVQDIITDSILTSSFRLRENGRPIRTYKSNLGADFSDADNYWNNSGERIAGDVHFGVQLLHTFMGEKFGWDSYANKNDSMISVLNLSGTGNAFWSLAGNYATFLAGSSSTVGPCASIDVVGHEFGHGIAEENAGLVYSGESCMLHESFADISGTLLERFYDSTKFNWLLGDMVWSGGIRNMQNPNAMSHPDTYKGKYFSGSGCHNNGEVQNYWFYLMAMGDTATNDFGWKYSVPGLGFEKATAIMYRAMFYYWTSNTDFAKANTYSLQAAKDLYGSCSDELKMTYDAWKAVGLEDTSFKVVDLTTDIIAPKVVCSVIPDTIRLYSKGDPFSTVTWYFQSGDSSKSKITDYIAKNTGMHTFLLKTEICGKTLWDTAQTVITYQPVAKFSFDKQIACNNGKDTVHTINQSVNFDPTKALKFDWTIWPYANEINAKNLTFAVKDKYELTFILKASYLNGCWDTVSHKVKVHDLPSISFTTASSCEGETYKFTNTTDTTGKDLSFDWYLDNQFISNGFNPKVVGKSSGGYGVKLAATDLRTGCTSETTSAVTIYKNPVPSFSINNPCSNQDMLLVNTTNHASPPNYFRWHLPTYKPYNKDSVIIQNGDLTEVPIALEYKDQNGCYGILNDTIKLESVTAEFGIVDSICSESDVKTSSIVNLPNTNIEWFVNEISAGYDTLLEINKIQSGLHKIRLLAIGQNCKSIKEQTIFAHQLPKPEFAIVKDICNGDTAFVLNQTKYFDHLDYTWSWGDGTTSGTSRPWHKYVLQNSAETESFIITLKAKEIHGCEGVLAKSITVNIPPSCAFSYAVNGYKVEFTPTVKDASFSYKWIFDDGQQSTEITPEHEYDSRQYYDVSLQIIDANGCVCESTQQDILSKVSVSEIEFGRLKITPNPGFNQFKIIGFEHNDLTNLSIHDMSGKHVYSVETYPNNGEIPLWLNLPAGIYNVSVYGQDIIKVLRLSVIAD